MVLNKIHSVTRVEKEKFAYTFFLFATNSECQMHTAHNCVAFELTNHLRTIRRGAHKCKKLIALDAFIFPVDYNVAGHYLMVNEKPIMPNSCKED